jgi:hypothetical protein
MDTETKSNLLHTLYNVGLVVFVLAGAGGAFMASNINNPNNTASIIIKSLFALMVLAILLAIGSRIAMSRFYTQISREALEQWASDPKSGDTVDAETLAKIVDLPQDKAWNIRQYLERKAAADGIPVDYNEMPNKRRYHFPHTPS